MTDRELLPVLDRLQGLDPARFSQRGPVRRVKLGDDWHALVNWSGEVGAAAPGLLFQGVIEGCRERSWGWAVAHPYGSATASVFTLQHEYTEVGEPILSLAAAYAQALEASQERARLLEAQ
jgi:hypothetical protein